MKILLVTEFFPTGKDLRFSGGVEARTFFIAKGLAKKHEVIVLASRTEKTSEKESLLGFKVVRVGPLRKYQATVGDLISRFRFIKDAVDFGKKLDADIVDGANFIAHFIAKQISLYQKIPAVAWYPDVWLGSWLKNAGLFGIFGELFERINLARGFNAYIAISKVTAAKLQKFTNAKINVIYCGVDKSEFIQKLQKFKDPTILCVSRLAKYKNIKTLILAFAHLGTKIKNARLIIVGTGPEENNLKRQAKALKLNSKVEFLSGFTRKKLIDFYKSAHIFCLPSLVEGFGIATIEAAEAGLPYVNSNIPIQKEVTKNGRGGYLVDSENPVAYSNKFEKLIKDHKLYQTKSQEAKDLATSYDWAHVAKETEKVYKSLVQKV